jgi:membrane fusion protein (multidrug efflux system)
MQIAYMHYTIRSDCLISRKGNALPAQFFSTTRSLADDGPRPALFAWLCAGLMLMVWLGWFVLGSVTLYETSTRARLEVRRAPHVLGAAVAGKVLSAAPALGQRVEAGAVLVELDAGAERLRLREELARLAAAGPRLASLQHEIAALRGAAGNEQAAARAALQEAQARSAEAVAAAAFAADNARRLGEESAAGSVPQIDALRAQSEAQRLAAAASALAAAVGRVGFDAAARGQQGQARVENLLRDAAALGAEQAAGRLAVERLQAEVERHLVRSPVAGRIGETQPLRPGAYAAAGERLVTVVPDGELVIVAEFAPAVALGRVRPGQTARLRLSGFPWTQYGSVDATVSRVASEVRDNLVRVELTPRGATRAQLPLQHGLPGTVEVVIDRVAPALMLLRASGQMLAPGGAREAAR